ncbi:putative anaerobic ribonucleoside-triphosphate reductase protein [Phaeoacremonium minimum UCRPA7]|uniref:Putative anaerobic ribonucleoside-triphosphate reductase protein n=1 Tax=Phaeoacremonium minimum (strain UCR-PA7) TaxID=1286976 RepID=R8BA87_PHAM7|nr:putative anaerobic ribonucleoside-triphosphate reductase protein [Phaeoacremonium minimum UCRPA7]EON96203.1 putative anaerobic ribonucleoside-triphosphate reductase protein [Phaeoacremonium minimum UCRPA7]
MKAITGAPSNLFEGLYRALNLNTSDSQADHIRLVEEYLTKATWKGAENANSTYSHQGLMQYVSGHIISDYWLNSVYTEEIRQYSNENRFHIHDLGFLSAYCSGWSIEDILLQGFGGVENKIQCRPPNHLNTALNQTVNFLFTLQGELAGAQALSNFDTYLAPFIRQDGLTYVEVFKYVQSFVYSLNVPTRSGFQAPFTNISMDLICPKSLVGHPVIIGGKYHEEWVYDDFQEEMDIFNRAFTAVMVQGDGNGSIFSFPIPTYNLWEGFDWQSPRFESIWEMTAKYGVPYFANFINSDLNPEDFRSMCCRLRLDVSKLHSRGGGLFGAVPLTGSIGVVTLNLPNLAMRSNGTKESFFAVLADTLRVAKDSLEIKRKIVDGHSALYPYAAHYLSVIKKRTGSYWTNHFSTIGVNGMNEALITLFGDGIVGKKDFAIEVLEFIKEELQQFQNETGNLFNLEATPAESTSYKLAQKDRELFPGKDIPSFYTNSTALPVDATEDLFEALDHQEKLQCAYTGGTVFHAFLGERLSGGKQARDLVQAIASRYRIPYISLTPTFSICKSHGYITGECPQCPKCGEEALVYSRIVGYFRPTRDWNKGKKEEFAMRKYYRYTAPASASSAITQLPSIADIKPPVAGYTKLTLSDYPGKPQASIMFTSRCNLACPWCHNGPVVRGRRDDVTIQDVLKHITASQHKCLVVSGGEPTIHAGLLPFLRVLKAAGISVKLDTNGTSPDVLRQVYTEGLVDFVAMDLKCKLDRYKEVAGRAVDPAVLEESINLIKDSGVPYQFRTTVVPDLVDIEDVLECKRLADGELTVQKFRKGGSNLHSRFRDAREHTDEEFTTILQRVNRDR